MPSFPDSIFLFVLALLLFGPKRLPVLARELGKWVGEFRRASNEFKMQMEDELRLSEQADKNKQIAAMEAAAPVAPAIAAELAAPDIPAEPAAAAIAEPGAVEDVTVTEPAVAEPMAEEMVEQKGYEVVDGVRTPLPIAVSGDLKIMPPATGLPVAQRAGPRDGALTGLLDAIPAAAPAQTAVPAAEAAATETTAHGD